VQSPCAMRNPIELPPQGDRLRQFLRAQLEWERYHASRMRLVHLLALGGLGLCVLLVARGVERLHVAALAAWSVCFAATAYAAIMEQRWRRQLHACAKELGSPKDPPCAS